MRSWFAPSEISENWFSQEKERAGTRCSGELEREVTVPATSNAPHPIPPADPVSHGAQPPVEGPQVGAWLLRLQSYRK